MPVTLTRMFSIPTILVLFFSLSLIEAQNSTVTNSTSEAPVATTSTPDVTGSASLLADACQATCTVCVPNERLYTWVPQEFGTTVVIATVTTFVNTVLNTTSTTVNSNAVPAGIQTYNLDAAGTQTTIITYTRAGFPLATTLTFPAAFADWPDGYFFGGTVPTTDSLAVPTCATASESSSFIATEYTGQPTDVPTTTVHPVVGPDPQGQYFSLAYTFLDAYTAYMSVFSTDSALQSCTPCTQTFETSPEAVVLNARFITDSTVITEGGSATSASTTPAESTTSQTTTSAESSSTTTGPAVVPLGDVTTSAQTTTESVPSSMEPLEQSSTSSSTTAVVSTTAVSTTPASTTPASTTPVSTTPVSTTAVSTTAVSVTTSIATSAVTTSAAVTTTSSTTTTTANSNSTSGGGGYTPPPYPGVASKMQTSQAFIYPALATLIGISLGMLAF